MRKCKGLSYKLCDGKDLKLGSQDRPIYLSILTLTFLLKKAKM